MVVDFNSNRKHSFRASSSTSSVPEAVAVLRATPVSRRRTALSPHGRLEGSILQSETNGTRHALSTSALQLKRKQNNFTTDARRSPKTALRLCIRPPALLRRKSRALSLLGRRKRPAIRV
ncbi:hypothetical protein EVAR_5792_1 [Eumeta japonica]|uniref:Uncharacterized protein n=1 Tax=Eumeta variegata TaxID=151549 RepID=A0A4C1T7F5_EUMVA|nr:hypothetical protein EVAR_5792_1 [Eumeta japonica]